MCKHTVGFEPTDTGFAAQRLEPLGDVCKKMGAEAGVEPAETGL